MATTKSTKTAARSKPKATKAAAKAPAAAKPLKKPVARRDDYGSPVEGFFAKQTVFRPLLDVLQEAIAQAAPDAAASLKWGTPFYTVAGQTMCAIGVHKSHVNLILAGPPETFADPGGLLEGDGKTGRRLKLTAGQAVPAKEVAAWLKAAVALARKNAG